MWVLDHLYDIESDLSAIHGITIDIDQNEWGGLNAPKFFRLAWRLPAYDGVISAILYEEKRKDAERHGGVNAIPLTPEMVKQSSTLEGLDGLIDYSTN